MIDQLNKCPAIQITINKITKYFKDNICHMWWNIYLVKFSETDFIKVSEKLIFAFDVNTDIYAVILSAKLNILWQWNADKISQSELVLNIRFYC